MTLSLSLSQRRTLKLKAMLGLKLRLGGAEA